MPGPCPTVERLAAALRGQQHDGKDAELAAHISECRACQAQLEALAGGSGWLEAKAKSHATVASPASDALKQTIAALESQPAVSKPEQASPTLKLDFLQPSDQPGVMGRFGPYEVIAHIASGGMGIVLKARDPALNRIVALKILSPTLAANALARARFVREARAAAAVVHENVVPIYAVDECAGLPYLVMQFVHGRSLAERIRATGGLSIEEILRIGAQTAAGLAAAHAQGLVHRDVKPGNILLENSVERVKLTDFGLARAVEDVGLTRTGELAGTPEFMSPEQASNEAMDHRADLFSLGSVLYVMCTGRSPFQGNSVVGVIRKVCDERPPPVHEINPAIPRWLSDIVARLMAKAPAERFQSAQEVGNLFERYLARVQHGELSALPDHWVQPAPTLIRRNVSYAIGIVALLAALGALMFVFKGRRALSPTAESAAASQSVFEVRNEAGKVVGSHTDLAEAARAAPSNGVVELRWNGPRAMPPVTLPPKPLTLRAAKGFRPIWIHTNLSVSALSASGALTMEDIELSLLPDATAAPSGPRSRPRFTSAKVGLIAISNAPLRLSRCVLDLPDPRLQPRGGPLGAAGLTVIILNNVAACELENSALLGAPWAAILWRRTAAQNETVAAGVGEARLTLSNCVVTAFKVFSPELPENSRGLLQMTRCTFQVRHLIDFSESGTARGLTVIAHNNLFATGAMIWDGRSETREALTASMQWQGRGNLFSVDLAAPRAGAYVVLNRTARSTWPDTLLEWNQWWPEPETGSRETTVTFGNAANAPASGSRTDFVRVAYKIEQITFKEGPPLTPEEWSQFGTDVSKVGPASAR